MIATPVHTLPVQVVFMDVDKEVGLLVDAIKRLGSPADDGTHVVKFGKLVP